MSLPPGPACLSNFRLDFNEFGAQRADVQRLVEECRREVRARYEADQSFGGSSEIFAADTSARGLRRCLDRHQDRRAEVWFLEPGTGDFAVFAKTQDSSTRREAVIECADYRPPSNLSAYDVAIGVARKGPRLVECMRSLRWEFLY